MIHFSKLLFVFVVATTLLSTAIANTGDSYTRALTQVQAAQQALGGADRLHNSAGISLHGEGDYDLAVRMQGRFSDKPNIVPIVEQLNYNPVTGATSYDSQSFANDDAAEHLRFAWNDDGRLLLLELINRRAFWINRGRLPETKMRYARMLPDVLLQAALENRATLRSLGKAKFGRESADVVSFTLPSNESLTLYLSQRSQLLLGVEYLLDMPQRGDTVVSWVYGNYREIPGLGIYPDGYRITLGNDLLKSVQYTRIVAGIDQQTLSIPDDITVPEPPEPVSESAPANSPDSLPELRELAAGVYLVPSIRPGFHVLLVEFPEYLLVVDTPAGYFEMQQMPAMNWAAGTTSSSVGRRLLETAQQNFPNKPVKYAALTHWHGDHSGGMRPFIAMGATLLASEHTVPHIETTARNTFTLVPDELTGKTVQPDIEVVNGRYVIRAGEQEVQLLDVGNNPHSESMLVVWLPGSKLLYVADLFDPWSEGGSPDRARVPIMKWFVEWLDSSDLTPETIIAIHGNADVTPQHLETIRTMSAEN